MLKVGVKTLCILILMICSTFAQFEGERCLYGETRAVGICTKIGNCMEAIADLRRNVIPQKCSFDGTVMIVCCPQSGKPAVTLRPTEPPTTTAPKNVQRPKSNSKTGCPPLDKKALRVKKNGQKAWDYCIDLAETIFRCKRSLLLGGPREREELCSHYVEGLVIGGLPAKKNEFPHMALLGYGEDLKRATYSCAGSLINKRWVLTAAHCLEHRENGIVKFVRLGSPNINDRIDTTKLYYIKRIEEHPNYAETMPQPLYNDIGLLELDRDVSFGPSVIPACLHLAPANTKKAVVSGWGIIQKNTKEMSNYLRKVVLEEFSHDECVPSHPRSLRLSTGVNEETQMCYGSRNESKDSCQGDSGGPIQIQNRNVYCTYTIIGIISTGKSCANKGIPAIYTRVAAYVPWIEKIAWP